MDISIIIVNYNTAGHLDACIESILKHTDEVDFEIIVVDNYSSERDIEKLPYKYPKVKFIFNKENRGFGAGCNIGIKNSLGKYCVFVNPDIIFTENILIKFFEFMETHSEAGACGGLLTNFEGIQVYTYNSFPGYFWELLQAVGKGTDYKINKLSKKLIEQENAMEVDWLMGAFIFTRRSIMTQINGFDETFFLYYEDVDIQYRIKQLSYKIYCLPIYKIKHFQESSVRSYHGENIYFYNMTRSKILYMYKHFGFFKRNIIRLMYLAGISMRVISLPVRLKFPGKKRQKISQYINMLSLFLKSKNKVLESKL